MQLIFPVLVLVLVLLQCLSYTENKQYINYKVTEASQKRSKKLHWSGNNRKILTDYHVTLHSHTEIILNHSHIIDLFQFSFSQCKRGYEQFTGVCLRYDWKLVWVILGVLFFLWFVGDSQGLCGKVFLLFAKVDTVVSFVFLGMWMCCLLHAKRCHFNAHMLSS